ncbi:MAG TPA: penicillin acylase family protein, partial [Streptosporangiaceae bacterium]
MTIDKGISHGWAAWHRAHRAGRRLAALGMAGAVAAGITAGAGPMALGAAKAAASPGHVAVGQSGGVRYQATIVRTAYGVPHITAHSFGSLGYGYGFALASDDLCMMAQIYVTVGGNRSRFFGPGATVQGPGGGEIPNLDSDIFWRSVIGRKLIPRLLAVRTGAGAIGPQVRRLMAGYVAGYNGYLASVGGAGGVPDPTCRGQAWVQPVTMLDAYLAVYQVSDLRGLSSEPDALAEAQPPAATTAGRAYPATASALSTLASSVVRAAPGTGGLPTASQLRKLGGQGAGSFPGTGSNAIAVGSAGTRDHQHGMLLGNPHILWQGALRLYQVQLTIPGTMNVEGATLIGIPVVVIGFTSSAAWSETTSRSWTAVPYQLTLVPGHPTEYVYNGRTVAMTAQPVTVPKQGGHGTIRHTVWFTRYGPVVNHYMVAGLPWTTKTAFALADENSGLRILSQFLDVDEAGSAAAVLASLKKFQGVPWNNTVVADATGHALYADILPVPDVTNAEAANCDTAIGKVTFKQDDLPVLDGSRPSCALGTGPGAAAPGIFGGGQEPTLMSRDFV